MTRSSPARRGHQRADDSHLRTDDSHLRTDDSHLRTDDKGMAMLFVVTCLVVSAGLVAAVLGVFTSELRPTAYERKSARTIAAAEAGLQAGLGVLRGATSLRPLIGLGGDLTLLPCLDVVRLTGTVGATSGNVGYSVRVRYFLTDPGGQSETWRTANALSCLTGSGPVQSPLFALLESSATGDVTSTLAGTAGDRSQSLVYTFNRTDAGILGGLVRTGLYTGSGDKCWTAPSVPAVAGMHLSLAACDDADPRQIFSYRQDYSLALSATQTSVSPPAGGMCVSAHAVGANSPIDGTGNGNDLLPQGSVAWEAPSALSGTAATLNGTDAYFQSTTAFTGSGSVSVAAWFRASSATNGFLVQFGSVQGLTPNSYDRQLWVDPTGALRFGTWKNSINGPVIATSPGTVTDGAWHFAVGSVGPAGLKLYLDGVNVATNAGTTAAEVFSGYWHVGAGKVSTSQWGASQPSSSYFHGDLAHATTWTSQLSDAQVSALYAQTSYSGFQSAVLTSSPQSYWALGGSQTNLDLTLQACTNTPPQRWSYNDAGRFELEKLDASSLSGLCINAADLIGAPLAVAACGSSREWTPAATAGAGAAGSGTGQLVNYGEYGRCLDVTNWNLNYPWLIDYPCKQDPTQAVGGNQRWAWNSSTGTIVTQYNTGYCLTSPTLVGGYVLTTPCTGGSNQRWTQNQDTGVRATAYTIVDSLGRCLSLGPPGTTTGGLAQWSSGTVAVCDGSFAQKWNAPAQLVNSTVSGQRETTNGR